MLSEEQLHEYAHADHQECGYRIGHLISEVRALRKVYEASKDLRRYCRECAGQEHQYYVAERKFDDALAAYEGGDSK